MVWIGDEAAPFGHGKHIETTYQIPIVGGGQNLVQHVWGRFINCRGRLAWGVAIWTPKIKIYMFGCKKSTFFCCG